MATNYAFHVAAEIISDKAFKDIPLKDICDAMRERLNQIEADGTREAFDAFDSFEIEGLRTIQAEVICRNCTHLKIDADYKPVDMEIRGVCAYSQSDKWPCDNVPGTCPEHFPTIG